MDWKQTALVVIDMENAFIDPASPLCIKNALATVPACGKVIEKARDRKIPVFFALLLSAPSLGYRDRA